MIELNYKYLAVIPARGGSKGIPNKNIIEIAGKPLVAWSILHAKNSKVISEVMVSTDSPEIGAVANRFGASVPFSRPAEISTDQASTESVLLHALDWYKTQKKIFDAVVLLQPTSPHRGPYAIDQAVAQFEAEKADSLLSACENHYFFWSNKKEPKALYNFEKRPRRQDISEDERWYRENGSIYITKSELLEKKRNRLGGKISIFLMSEEESYEIDSLTDLKVVSTIMESKIK